MKIMIPTIGILAIITIWYVLARPALISGWVQTKSQKWIEGVLLFFWISGSVVGWYMGDIQKYQHEFFSSMLVASFWVALFWYFCTFRRRTLSPQ